MARGIAQCETCFATDSWLLGIVVMAKFYCADVYGVLHFGATAEAAMAKALRANRTYP